MSIYDQTRRSKKSGVNGGIQNRKSGADLKIKDLKELFDKLSATKRKLEISQSTISSLIPRDEEMQDFPSNIEDSRESFKKRTCQSVSSKKLSTNSTQDDSKSLNRSAKPSMSKDDKRLKTLEECESENIYSGNEGSRFLEFVLNEDEEVLTPKLKASSLNRLQKSYSMCTNTPVKVPIQWKFFDRAAQIEKDYQSFQSKVEQDIKNLSNTCKITASSYRLIISRLEESLSSIIREANQYSSNPLDFQQLGRVMSQASIFRILKFDDQNKLTESDIISRYSHNGESKRRYDEMMMHEQIWMIFADASKGLDWNMIFAILRVLLDPIRLSVEETAQILREYHCKYSTPKQKAEKTEAEDDIVPWSIEKLVKKFRKLIENRLHHTKIGYLKPSEAQEYLKREEENTFTPFINKNSLVIDYINTCKFIEAHFKRPEEDLKSPEKPLENVKSPHSTSKSHCDLRFLTPRLNATEGFLPEVPMERKIERNLTSYRERREPRSISRAVTPDKRLDSDMDRRVCSANPRDRYLILLKRQELADKWRESEQKKKMDLEMKECTFTPDISKKGRSCDESLRADIVDRLYSENLQMEKEFLKKQNQELKEKKEVEVCTFTPKIKRSVPKALEESPKPVGFFKSISRLRIAREDSLKRREALERIPKGERYEELRNSCAKPFAFLSRKKEDLQKKPFLIIDVNFGKGRSGKIGLHEGDDPFKLSENFSKTYQLTIEQQEKLAMLLEEQLMSRREAVNATLWKKTNIGQLGVDSLQHEGKQFLHPPLPPNPYNLRLAKFFYSVQHSFFMFTEILEKRFEELDIIFQLIYLKDSIIIFIVDEKLELNNFYSAIQTKYEKLPTVCNLFDEEGRNDEEGIHLISKVLCEIQNMLYHRQEIQTSDFLVERIGLRLESEKNKSL